MFCACCAHEGGTGTDESAQMLIRNPVSTGSVTYGSCFHWITSRSRWVILFLWPANEFERVRPDSSNVPGLVLEVSDQGLYKVGTKHGVINTTCSQSQLLKAVCALLKRDDHCHFKTSQLCTLQQVGRGSLNVCATPTVPSQRCPCLKKKSYVSQPLSTSRQFL